MKCSTSLGIAGIQQIAGLLTLCRGQGDCRNRPSLSHVCAKEWHLQMTWRLMGSRRVSVDSLKAGVLPSPCTSHIFSLYVRGFQPKYSGTVRVVALGRRWRMGWATFPSQWWEGTYRLFAPFSWWVEAWQHRHGRMLSITLPGNFTHCQGKPECLSKGFGTGLTSENKSMKSSSRGT